MKSFHIIAFIVILNLVLSVFTLAQKMTNGTGGGKWSSSATWQAGAVPSVSDNIVIQASDSLAFDMAVTLTGTVKTLSGRVSTFDSSKIIFGNGGTYEHAVNGGSIPKATWTAGSTCLLTGIVGNAPSNGNQSFYNLTWNCPGQTGGLNLGMSTPTIGGTIKVINSNSQFFRLTAGNVTVPGGRKLITINGNIVVDSSTAFFTATGSGSPNDTFSVLVKGNINSKGRIDLGNGSGGLVTWLVAGNITASEGTFTTHSSAPSADTLVFNGTTKQVFTRGGAVSSSNIRYVVKSGAIVDFDTSTVGGSAASTFRLEAGATIISGRSNGLKGNLNNGGATTLDTAANYEYDGTAAQSDTTLPSVVNNLTINNAAGFTLKNSVKINGVLSLKAGMLDNTIPFTFGKSGSIAFLGGSLKVPVTAVHQINESGIPQSFFVEQNYPNPFNPSTLITYGIAKNSYVTATIYNLLGQEVAAIADGYQNAGIHTLRVNASHLSSGVYLFRIQADNVVETKRMILMK